MPTHQSRGRHRDRSSRYSPAQSKPSSPSETVSDPSKHVLLEATADDASFAPQYGRYNYMNFPPGPDVWRADDFLTIAGAVHNANDVRPASLMSSDAVLPEQLSRKSVSDVREVINHLLRAFNDRDVSFAPPRSPHNFIAVLASEYSFMMTHAHERNLALLKLVESRDSLNNAENTKSQLERELSCMNAQIDKERERRSAAVERRNELEKAREEVKTKVESERQDVKELSEALEKACVNDLEVRRRLDRIHLKVEALRGKMIVPTVDQLLMKRAHRVARTKGNGVQKDVDMGVEENVIKEEDNLEEKDDMDVDDLHPFSRYGFASVLRRPGVWDDSSLSSAACSESSDDTEVDLDEEAMEFRLLKNRLAMVENEAAEWKATLQAKRARLHMVSRARDQLDEEITRLKQGLSSKSSATRAAAKTESRSHGKVRLAVRTSISHALAEASPKKTVRKGRKRKNPKRSLIPDHSC